MSVKAHDFFATPTSGLTNVYCIGTHYTKPRNGSCRAATTSPQPRGRPAPSLFARVRDARPRRAGGFRGTNGRSTPLSRRGRQPDRRLAMILTMPGLRILTFAPIVSERDGVLHARTSLLLRVLTLGAVAREVVVDRRSRYVTIDERLRWFHRRRRIIPFRMIRRIAYDYDSTVTSLHGSVHGAVTGDEIPQRRLRGPARAAVAQLRRAPARADWRRLWQRDRAIDRQRRASVGVRELWPAGAAASEALRLLWR